MKNNQSAVKKHPQEIRTWLINSLAKWLEMNSDDIDTSVEFEQYGLDSAASIGLMGELEDWLGQEITPYLIYEYPTVDALVNHLSS